MHTHIRVHERTRSRYGKAQVACEPSPFATFPLVTSDCHFDYYWVCLTHEYPCARWFISEGPPTNIAASPVRSTCQIKCILLLASISEGRGHLEIKSLTRLALPAKKLPCCNMRKRMATTQRLSLPSKLKLHNDHNDSRYQCSRIQAHEAAVILNWSTINEEESLAMSHLPKSSETIQLIQTHHAYKRQDYAGNLDFCKAHNVDMTHLSWKWD
jgi:hypothetical protein